MSRSDAPLPLRLFRWLGRRQLVTLRRLGRWLGTLLDMTGSGPARVTRINIGVCFPELTDPEQRALVRASLVETACTGLEMAWAWEQPVERVLNHIEAVEAPDLFQADGRGLIVLAPHLGNWEVLGLWLGQTQPRMASLYAPPHQAWLEPYMRAARERSGATLHPTDRKGVMQLARCLREGGTVGILPDQEPDFSAGEFAPFFRIPANTMTLAAKLAQRTRARAVVAAALRTSTGFRIVAEPVTDAFYDENLIRALTAMNSAIERLVRRAPAQYQWEYKRFKRRPEKGVPHFYDRNRLT